MKIALSAILVAIVSLLPSVMPACSQAVPASSIDEAGNDQVAYHRLIEWYRACKHNILGTSTQYLKPGSDWDHLAYEASGTVLTDRGTDWEKAKSFEDDFRVGFVERCVKSNPERLRLANWFHLCEKNFLDASTPEERALDGRSLVCTFCISSSGVIEDLRIEQSSGSSEVDKKALALLQRASLRKIAPPPDTTPFYGVQARFCVEPLLSLNLKPHPLPEVGEEWPAQFDSSNQIERMSNKPGFNAPDVFGGSIDPAY